MKTLYTGHVTIGTHEVYSFIYADTLLEAEAYLTDLLGQYVRERHNPVQDGMPEIRVISRPDGWEPPDGYYLPATSTQYALRYSTHQHPQTQQTTPEQHISDEVPLPQSMTALPSEASPQP
jgi:hypothetical protein